MSDHSLTRGFQCKHQGTNGIQKGNPFLGIVHIYRFPKVMNLLQELRDLLRHIRRDWHCELVMVLGVGPMGLSASIRTSLRHFLVLGMYEFQRQFIIKIDSVIRM